MTSSQAAASSIRAAFVNVDMNPFVAGMNSTFDAVKKGAVAVRGVLAAAAAGAAGLGVFVKLADDAERATLQTEILARTLGITTQEAAALKLVLNDIGVGVDDYTALVGKMTVKLRENEQSFNALGMVTRGANHELINGREAVDNALAALLKFKEGNDRNLASTVLFGRGWSEVVKLMRLTPEAMQAARVKAEELQLSIGPEGVERAHAYQAAMSDVKDILEGLWNRIGTALMPVLTDLGEWFATLGPAAVLLMRGAIGGLTAGIHGFMFAVRIAFNVAASTIYALVEPLAAVAEAASLAITGDFAGAGRRLGQISENVEANWKRNFDQIMESARKTSKELLALFDQKAEQGEPEPGKPGGRKFEDPAKEKQLLDLRRNAERDYQLSRIALERDTVETLEQLGIINTNQKLDALRRLKAAEYQIELKALGDKLQLMDPTTDPVHYEEQLNRIKTLKQKHAGDMAKIDNQAALEAKKNLDTWLDPAGNAFQKFVDGAIAGTRKWSDVVRGALASMAQEYLATIVKLGVNWVKTELLKTNATVAGVTARTGAEATGASASVLMTAGTAVSNITAKAFEAAGSVYASIAQIPVVGPFLAPAMALAAAATVIGFIGHIAHAAQGFDVPSGMNPITRLHSEEMVLPADIANPLRAALAGGGGGMGGEDHWHIHTPSVKEFRRFLMENRHSVADALRASTRDFR
jgi:hypothetical protein